MNTPCKKRIFWFGCAMISASFHVNTSLAAEEMVGVSGKMGGQVSMDHGSTMSPWLVAAVEAEAPQKPNKWGGDPHQIEQRLKSLSSLIENSTGARKIVESANREAQDLQGKARGLKDQAESSFRAGQFDQAKKYLGEASQMMFQAIRKADGGDSGRMKEQDDFDRRLKSVDVLKEAHERISKEKKSGEETNGHIATARSAALDFIKAGNHKEARSKLDEAYVIAKLGIEKLRRGDTLVRSLNFKSKEEEYHYEIDRNDTHKMLVKMLLESKSDSAKKMAEKFVSDAGVLRERAEKEAGAKKFEAAVTTLEESTKELVKAIRSAGIYIPG